MNVHAIGLPSAPGFGNLMCWIAVSAVLRQVSCTWLPGRSHIWWPHETLSHWSTTRALPISYKGWR